MMLAERRRPAYIGTPTDGSRTITLRDVPTSEAAAGDDDIAEFSSHPRPVLKLRGGPRSEQRVAWKEGVVDNENAGKRKSKICCIYHKPKRFDESSDESSDESEDDGRARPASSRRARKPKRNHHHHSHGESPCGSPSGGASATRSESGVITELERPHSPNAYELQPRNAKHDNGSA